jgi:hypothetical protein
VNPLVIIFLRKLGVPAEVLKSLAGTWANITHHIKTMYGISDELYQNSLEYFLFGPGQGSTIGPLLWLICFLLIVRSLSRNTPSISLRSVNGATKFSSEGDAFIDDAGLGSTIAFPSSVDHAIIQRSPPQVIANLQKLAQQWERLLFSTGGALNLQKCFWFVMHWTWNAGHPVLATTATLPANLSLTSGQDLGNEITIPRIEPSTPYRTLGVHITPSGSSIGATQVLQDIVLEYAQAITGSYLSRKETIMSYVQHLLPKLRFQLPALSFKKSDCEKLMSVALNATLPKMHVNLLEASSTDR